ncbi:MAG: iron-sulfur cluster-binding protein [Anaerolineae bacterium]
MTAVRVVQAAIAARADLPGHCLLSLEAGAMGATSAPGQFAMVRCSARYDPYLRRPLPFLSARGNRLSFLFPARDVGLHLLSRQPLGTSLDLLAPLGRGFTLVPATRRLLLATEGGPLAPLLFLAEAALARDVAVTLVLGAGLQPLAALVPGAVELAAATAGAWNATAELLPWADQVAVTGDVEALRTLAACVPGLRPGLVQAWVETPMACGVGACGACVAELRRGPRRTCVAGPVFDLLDIV